MGLIVGSISFVGGPGTAMAWAKEAQAVGVVRAPELAMAAATLAVISGALVSGPITSWLIRRRGLEGPPGAVEVPWLPPTPGAPAPHAEPLENVMRALLFIFLAVALGERLNVWASHLGLVLPGFLTAMLAGVAITNVADADGRRPRVRAHRAQRGDRAAGVPGHQPDEPEALDHRRRGAAAAHQRRGAGGRHLRRRAAGAVPAPGPGLRRRGRRRAGSSASA